ncbi:DEAD/DEAH box helicase [Salipaludibacillus agaradhaerens]|jgi:replicative superfamily II helicase|uniref:DEAD/DEAH box helicase n=1 Tax=Salipaludibacillus agaradhaerens TaxID=76935 RepID=A0A9Q4B3Q0_SALAG|nr:DEAD/DEAH box helicase [Salipaludibacillus agaradhaerens]MCR6097762.1 DEAD/DEAH box helicase [Salipaludibacillus agaradhaerens]MCR6112754.1 DEAD/DEAH box helicase [Salipaludibacillus agaradhaerens]
MNSILFDWIRDSNSWRNAKSLNLLNRQEKEYAFLLRTDDFYISLFNNMFRALTSGSYQSSDKHDELLLIAKGIEMYSLDNTRGDFYGVNYAENILYASSIYYLTDYYTTSALLSKLFHTEDYESDIDKFIHGFLTFNRHIENPYMELLNLFLETGQQAYLEDVLRRLKLELTNADPYGYAPLLLAKCLLEKFIGNNIWSSLTRANPHISWQNYIIHKLNKNWVLFPSQITALEKGILIRDNTFSLQMPTSSGKTSLCEIILYNEIIHNRRKVLLLAPYRALASELNYSFRKTFNTLGVSVKTLYGGHSPTREEKAEIDKVDLLICTPEKFMALENNIPNLHELFSTVICDEGHLLDDEHRGLSYELLLAKLKESKNEQSTRKYIYISAIIPNLDNINKWLGGDENTIIKSSYRPTHLTYGFLIEKGTDKNKTFDLDIYSKKNNLLDSSIEGILSVNEDYKYRNHLTKRVNTYSFKTFKAKAASIALRSLNNGSVAIYTPQKGDDGVKGLAEEVIKQIDLLSFQSPETISQQDELNLSTYFEMIFGRDYILTKSINYGFAIHHGDLPQFVREIIEMCIRERVIHLVICTSTLAEGVNLPIKTIILHTIKRFNSSLERKSPIRKRDIKNIVGRAGRAGQETEGIVISVNPSEYSYIKEVIDEEQLEPVSGYLYQVINGITKTLKKRRLLLSNELIEAQDEEFKRLIDSIDKSIIDSLYEEITDENLEEILKDIISRTYSYYQSGKQEKETLENIYALRAKVITPYFNKKQLKSLKESGTSIRIFEDILEVIDLQDELWKEVTLPFSENTFEYFIEIVFKLQHIQYDINHFQVKTKITLTKEVINNILINWMEGKWYFEISNTINIELDDLLKIMLFIDSVIYPALSNIITIVKNKLSEEGISISKDLDELGKIIQYGVNSRIHCNLIDLGFTDRMSLFSVSKWLTNNFKSLNLADKNNIEMILRSNKIEIEEYLNRSVPKISSNQFKANLKHF